MTSVGVVVPAYRPDPTRLRSYLEEIQDRLDPAILRVELDAPGDVDVRVDDLPATVHVVSRRRGKGAAVTAGFQAVVGSVDVLAFADADGATPVASLADVVTPAVSGDADLAVGSRRHPAADVRSHQTFARRFLGDGFAWVARRLLDAKLHDYQCGAKALPASTWRTVRPHLYEPGFAWDIELIAVAAALDCRITEVPVTWKDQPGSTVSPVGDAIDLARGLLISRHRARLLQEDRLHRLLDSREASTALVDRGANGTTPPGETGAGGDPR